MDGKKPTVVLCGICGAGAKSIAEAMSKANIEIIVRGGDLVEVEMKRTPSLEDLINTAPVRYADKAFRNREPKSYDKFLPKPVGMQRRRK